MHVLCLYIYICMNIYIYKLISWEFQCKRSSKITPRYFTELFVMINSLLY